MMHGGGVRPVDGDCARTGNLIQSQMCMHVEGTTIYTTSHTDNDYAHMHVSLILFNLPQTTCSL